MSSQTASQFISRWACATPSERVNSQLFLSELCDLLGLPHPDATPSGGYAFEYEVTQHHPDGSTTSGRIDLYKRGCFVLESKQFQAAQEAGVAEKKKSSRPVRGTDAWDDAMVKAREEGGQARRQTPVATHALRARQSRPKVLSKTQEPLTPDAVAARFLNARRAHVADILDTLCTMGHAHRGKSKGTYLP